MQFGLPTTKVFTALCKSKNASNDSCCQPVLVGNRNIKTCFPVITFMIARDPYLQAFVRQFTEVNGGKAFYSSLDGLGSFVFEDYERNKRKTLR